MEDHAKELETALRINIHSQLSLSNIRKPVAMLNNVAAHHHTHEENARAFPPLYQRPK